MKTPPLGFTEDNFCAVVRASDLQAKDIKTETRRLLTLKSRTQEEVNEITSFCQDGDGNWISHFGNTFGDLTELAEFTKKAYPKGSNKGIKSKYQIGDHCYLTEPTRIVLAPDQSLYYQVEYFWHDPKTIQKLVTLDDIAKILGRKTGIYSKQIARFMLKSFARYWVEITDVRLERLLDITEEAAIAEGIKTHQDLYGEVGNEPYKWGKTYYFDYMKQVFLGDTTPIQSYLSEIAAIHKPSKDKIGGWDLVKSNPWVWVYQFKLVTEQS